VNNMVGLDTNQPIQQPVQATQPMQTQDLGDASSGSEPDSSSKGTKSNDLAVSSQDYSGSDKKKSNHVLMIFILIALVVIFLLLIYAITANNEVSQMQTGTQTQGSGVTPITNKVILNPSVAAETADDIEISDIEGDIESLDRELQEL